MADISTEFDHALYVLAITVIIDQRVRERELSEFCEQATGMAPLCGFTGFNDKTALDWYENHQADIREHLSGRSRNTVILKAITRVQDEVVREALYDAMLAVSISDDEYHQKESDLVKSAAAIWGYIRPPFKVAKSDAQSDGT